jgi:hypothetical protein
MALFDIPLELTKVCFEGKNGHAAGVTPFPLMTQSRHHSRIEGRTAGIRIHDVDSANTYPPLECLGMNIRMAYGAVIVMRDETGCRTSPR